MYFNFSISEYTIFLENRVFQMSYAWVPIFNYYRLYIIQELQLFYKNVLFF